MGSFMSGLADNYLYGIAIAVFLVVVGYIAYSVLVLLSCRKVGIDICVSAMIPVYNLILLIRRFIRKYKNSQIYKEDEEIEL